MAEDARTLVRRKAEEKGLGEYWDIIDQLVNLESGWNPSRPSDFNVQGTEDSWGLFQNNRAGGLGTGYSVAQLQNPDTNAEIALSKIASVIDGGGTIYDALGDWVNARNIIFSGQGGGTMPNGQPVGNERLQQIMAKIDELLRSDDPRDAIDAADLIRALPTEAKNAYFGFSDGGEQLPLYQEAPSPQAQAVGQFDIDRLVADHAIEAQKLGWDVAGQNFANALTQLTATQGQADWAQQYASKIAPPGVTTVFGTGPESATGQLASSIGMNLPAAQLPLAPAATPQQAMQQAGAVIPQPPQLQYEPQALAGPDLSQLSPFPQTQPFGMPQAQLPTPGGGAQGYQSKAESLMQAIAMILGPNAGNIGRTATQPLLPIPYHNP